MTDVSRIADFATLLIDNVSRVIVGKRPALELLTVALLCDGHVLIEDVPGVGKTMLARAMATSMGGSFKRLQCTPDLLPNDVTGVSVFNQAGARFEFRPGPVFVNVLLADEINRATPRTQAALLEAMQERQVTLDGETRPLPRPFLVLATENPVEFEGTFPLPEAQLDRFLMRIGLGYPSAEDEKALLRALRREHPIDTLDAVTDAEALLSAQRLVWDVHLDETLEDYLIRLVTATRSHADLTLGASPRASLALARAARALAAVRGRDHVLPDDLKALAPHVLAHRLIVRPESELRGRNARGIVAQLLESTPLAL
ncbi:MAG: MoxR family ATPase [Thermoflexales bacterium]|nr:MoxR family ATPase [Thermoflexales bacterium]